MIAAAMFPRPAPPEGAGQYESLVRLLVEDDASSVFESVESAAPLVAREVEVIRSSVVADEVEMRIGFRPEITVSGQPEGVITIRAVRPTALEAREVAATYASSYLDVRMRRAPDEQMDSALQLLDRISSLDNEIATVDPDSEDARRLLDMRRELADQYDLLTATADIGAANAPWIIDEATVPGDPIDSGSDPLLRNLAIGALAAIVLSAVLWRPLGQL